MFSHITPGGTSGSVNPNPQQPTPEAPKANEGGITLDDAVKGGEHTKLPIFSASGGTTTPLQPGAPGTTVQLGSLVQGKVVVDLMDALLPALLVLLFRKMKLDVRKTQMQLTAGEKNTLAPIVEACLQSINLDFSNPWVTLAFSAAIIYGGKVIEVGGVQWLDKKAGEGQPLKEKPPPVVNMGGAPKRTQPPTQNQPKPATDTAPFVDIKQPENVIAWSEEDLRRVRKWGGYGEAKARQWLEKNWIKLGCKLPEKWNKPIPVSQLSII
jgi:hypothetical protein